MTWWPQTDGTLGWRKVQDMGRERVDMSFDLERLMGLEWFGNPSKWLWAYSEVLFLHWFVRKARWGIHCSHLLVLQLLLYPLQSVLAVLRELLARENSLFREAVWQICKQVSDHLPDKGRNENCPLPKRDSTWQKNKENIVIFSLKMWTLAKGKGFKSLSGHQKELSGLHVIAINQLCDHLNNKSPFAKNYSPFWDTNEKFNCYRKTFTHVKSNLSENWKRKRF